MMAARCPECDAIWEAGVTCEGAFHQMLFWESEEPALGEVHHLMVVCFHLQHPSRMSPDGLVYQIRLLADFVEGGVSPEQVRRSHRAQVDSGKRDRKVTSRQGEAASYPAPVAWQMTAPQVAAAGKAAYVAAVRRWAALTNADLKGSATPG